MHKSWLHFEATKSSTWREIKAIQLCLLAFSKKLKESTVTFYTDSQNAASIVLKGSRIPELQALALSIFNVCRQYSIVLHTVWIPRGQNAQADFFSRIIDIDDWETTVDFFDFLNKMWGPHSVDMFANVNNAKTKHFNSLYWNPRTLGVDAFNSNWSNDINWLVPPGVSVPRVINHLVECKARGTLVVPKWPSSPFWPLIFESDHLVYKPYVRDVLEFSETSRILAPGQNLNSIFANGTFKGTILSVKLDASLC